MTRTHSCGDSLGAANYDASRRIKSKYDPENVFRIDPDILPEPVAAI